jgi:hypothetical protein
MKNLIFTSLSFLLLCYKGTGQTINSAGLFPTIDHTSKLTEKLDLSLYYFGALPKFQTSPQSNEKNIAPLLLYSEQSVNYMLNNNFSCAVSYVFQRENKMNGTFANENRIHIQTTYKKPIAKANLKFRLRFDNRFISIEKSDYRTYNNRLRCLFGFDFPISSKKNNLYIAAYEEAFFNTTAAGQFLYQENWASIALGIKINNANKIECGPLFINWKLNNLDWHNQYYAQISWVSSLNFSTR